MVELLMACLSVFDQSLPRLRRIGILGGNTWVFVGGLQKRTCCSKLTKLVESPLGRPESKRPISKVIGQNGPRLAKYGVLSDFRLLGASLR